MGTGWEPPTHAHHPPLVTISPAPPGHLHHGVYTLGPQPACAPTARSFANPQGRANPTRVPIWWRPCPAPWSRPPNHPCLPPHFSATSRKPTFYKTRFFQSSQSTSQEKPSQGRRHGEACPGRAAGTSLNRQQPNRGVALSDVAPGSKCPHGPERATFSEENRVRTSDAYETPQRTPEKGPQPPLPSHQERSSPHTLMTDDLRPPRAGRLTGVCSGPGIRDPAGNELSRPRTLRALPPARLTTQPQARTAGEPRPRRAVCPESHRDFLNSHR